MIRQHAYRVSEPVSSVVRTLDFRPAERVTPCACGGWLVAGLVPGFGEAAVTRDHAHRVPESESEAGS